MGDLKDVLLMMDSYFIYPRITFKQKEKYNTYIGLIFTIISICLFVILISINIKKVFSRTHFNLISSLIDTNDILELKNIQLSIGLLKNYTYFIPIDKQYIDFELIQYFYTSDFNFTFSKINLFNCNNVSNSDFIAESFDLPKEMMGIFLCTQPNQTLYILPRAGTRSSVFSMLYLNILKCNETDETCDTNSIYYNLTDFFILLAYMNNNVNHYNYSNPIFQTPRFDAFFFTGDVIKEVNYYFQKNVYETDDGLLFENKKNESYITFDRFFSDYKLKNDENDINYGSIQFFGNNYINYYQRAYIRIFDIIADVKSYVDIVYSFINIFMFFIVRNMFYVNMMQCIYFNNDDFIYKNTIKYIYDKKNENIKLNLKENIFDNKRKKIKPKTLNVNKKREQYNFNEKDEQSSQRKIKKKSKSVVNLKKTEQKLDYKFYYYICPLICFKTDKNIVIYNKLYDEIINNIGLENIYKNLYVDKEKIFKNFFKEKEKEKTKKQNFNEYLKNQ